MSRRRLLGIGGLALLVVVVAVGATYGTNLYFGSQYAQKNKGCQPSNIRHQVTIENGVVSPVHTDAARCELLTITNQDTVWRLVAFGRHDDHVPYDGVGERYLSQAQSLTVTLDQTGEFLFHDHLHDEVQGTFTVK